jgi:hypothetical protein
MTLYNVLKTLMLNKDESGKDQDNQVHEKHEILFAIHHPHNFVSS